MSCIQFFVSGILSLPVMFVLETPRLVSVAAAWMPLLYAGVLSCGVAYTLQILGQKNVNPAVASLILSLGILLFSACGLDHTWRTFVIQRIVRMHTDVSGNYTGTASG